MDAHCHPPGSRNHSRGILLAPVLYCINTLMNLPPPSSCTLQGVCTSCVVLAHLKS